MLWIFLATAWVGYLGVSPAGAAEVVTEDSIRKYRFLAKDAREKKDLEVALSYYREYLKYRPDDPKAFFWVGEILYDQGEFAGARQAFGQAVALDSLHLNSNLMLYQVFLRTAEPDSAAPYLERVLRLKPDEPKHQQYCRNLADLYSRQGNTRQALHYYIQAAERDSSDGQLAEVIAVLYQDLGEAAQALQWRQRLLAAQRDTAGGSVSPDQRATLESMVELQVKTGDSKAAFATLMQLVQLDSLNRYAYYSRLVQVAEKADDQAMRLKGWEGMAQANPKDVEPLIKLAEWHLNAGQIGAAQRWVLRGLRAEPRSAYLLLLKGDCLARQGAEEEAIAAYEQAKADPAWAGVAQQRIWQLRPPETQEEKLKREFFGKGKSVSQEEEKANKQ